ncbi:MAG TPA: hypothetical protein VER58_11700 [Thermoanaerobaculia bacterium]|nr:hypothetical protein [Thermoanaerobaculia bacterium]
MFRREFLQAAFLSTAVLLIGSIDGAAQSPPPENPQTGGDFAPFPQGKIPLNAIIVRGAEPSASDQSTPPPEDGAVSKSVYRNRYFAMTYPLPANWMEAYQGPPPSDSGKYVLAQWIPSPTFKGPAKGTVLISAQDMFFSPMPARTALELIGFSKDHLPDYYEVEHAPSELTISGRIFARFDYKSAVAGLHWHVLATQFRCHAIEFVFTSQDTRLLDALIADMSRMQLSSEAVPACIANYAVPSNIVYKVDPILTDRRFNAIPVRIIIDKSGRVRHVHVISAFADQATKITDALLQWTFKPYTKDGQPVELETGIMFRSGRNGTETTRTAASTND